jgi:hypothetical protein
MKATTKLTITVLALAFCAATALPATVMAKAPSPADSLHDTMRVDLETIQVAQPAEPVHIIGQAQLVGNLELVHEAADAGDSTLGEPPVAPADEADAPNVTDPTHAPEVPSMVVTQSVEPNATPWMLAGLAAMVAGGALVIITARRKASAR